MSSRDTLGPGLQIYTCLICKACKECNKLVHPQRVAVVGIYIVHVHVGALVASDN